MAKKKSRQSPRYTGVLAEHILLPDRDTQSRWISPRGLRFRSSAEEAADDKQIKQAWLAKVPALFDHFGINSDDPNAWQLLAFALAFDHVPGFRFRRATGAPTSVGLPTLCNLYRLAIAFKAKRRRPSEIISDSRVCRDLNRQTSFHEACPELAQCSPRRLQNLLSQARNLRKERVRWVVSNCARKRSLKGEQDPFPRGDSPFWLYETTL